MAIIEVADLQKRYGATVAVADVTFTVAEGEIFGLLGPNGAGKTTTVETIAGLRVPDSGTIRVLGLDPLVDGAELRERVGVQLQESALPPKLRLDEAVALYSSFYRRPADGHRLIETLGLSGKQHAYFKDLSGGQKQRLSVVLALIGEPMIAVLDELTTGLDPQARRDTWELIEAVRRRGVTIVLVTHNMEEAQHLCDRVALIDAGRTVAVDEPALLAERTAGGKRVRFRPSAAFDDSLLTRLPEVRGLEHDGDWMVATGQGELVNAVILSLHDVGITARDVATEAGALEDAYLALTGHGGQLSDDGAAADGGRRTSARPHRLGGWHTGIRRRGRRRHASPPAAAFRRLVQTEWRLALRSPAGVVWAFGFPIVFLIVFGALPSMNSQQSSLGGFTAFQVYLPIMIGFALTMLSLVVLPVPLVTYRELGVLRRMATTPVPPTWLLGAQIVINLALFAVAVAIIVGGVAIVFGAHLSLQPAGFALSLVLAVPAMFSLGLCVASIARTQRAAGAIGGLLFFAMVFCAGLWLPRQSMPSWLRTISGVAPMGAAVHALDTSMLSGGFPPVQPLLVMVLSTVVFGGIAIRMFRWE